MFPSPVPPSLQSEIVVISRTQYTLTVRFAAWSPENGGGVSPTGYIIQMGNIGVAWKDAADVQHNASSNHVTVRLQGLMSDTAYFMRLVPYVIDTGIRFLGEPTIIQGPASTLAYGKHYQSLNLFRVPIGYELRSQNYIHWF